MHTKKKVRIGAPLPREHGAWAMFLTPVLVGMGAAGKVSMPVLLFAATAFGFFMLRFPLMLAVKSRAPAARQRALLWTAVYGLGTGIVGIALLIFSPLWLLVPIAVLGALCLGAYLWQAYRRAEMSLAGEWTGIAGLALGAPGAYLVGSGRLDSTALGIYLLNLLYFGGTVFYAKYRVREQPRLGRAADQHWAERVWAGRVTLGYHVLALAVVAMLATQGLVPLLALLAFVPMICKAVGGILAAPTRPNMRRLGLIEVALTVVFAATILLAYA